MRLSTLLFFGKVLVCQEASANFVLIFPSEGRKTGLVSTLLSWRSIILGCGGERLFAILMRLKLGGDMRRCSSCLKPSFFGSKDNKDGTSVLS